MIGTVERVIYYMKSCVNSQKLEPFWKMKSQSNLTENTHKEIKNQSLKNQMTVSEIETKGN